jgi:prolyl-tRNA synthetase
MKGVPVRVEIGPKDIEAGQAVLVRRDTREKFTVSLDNIEDEVAKLLADIQASLFNKAAAKRDAMTSVAVSMDEMAEIIAGKKGFIKAMWCGSEACEDAVKERTGAGSRCIPFEQERVAETCVCCGKEAVCMVYWGKAY